jgi:hypothetical protein
MMDQKPRRFNMGDLMIFVAAIALGAAGTRGVWFLVDLFVYTDRVLGLSLIATTFAVGPTLVGAWLLPLTAGFVLIRLRRPRPGRVRLIFQPGMAAACAVGTACVFEFVGLLFHFAPLLLRQIGFDWTALRGGPPLVSVSAFNNVVFALPLQCGYGIAVIWFVLWLSGLWRAEKSWIDRFGRVLGVLWITISVISSIP